MLARISLAQLFLVLLHSLHPGFCEVPQCTLSTDTQPKLSFVAHLSVNGCAIFVHDTGASDGPHLVIEPLVCVTQSLNNVFPRYDPVTQQRYVSVPVMLRDDEMLAEVKHRLRHLSPKSVELATVSDVSVSEDNTSMPVLQAFGFDWTPDEPFGTLRIGCRSVRAKCSAEMLASRIRSAQYEALLLVLLHMKFNSNCSIGYLKRRVNLKYQTLHELEFLGQSHLPPCGQLRFIKSIRVNNCTARVHQRLDMKGHFLIEPLLCHNITSFTNESIMYDYSRDMYYLSFDVLLQDDSTLDAVRSNLADLSPLNVTFLRLWRAESVVASALSRRFEIGGLMVSGDWRSGQLRMFCRTEDECLSLRASVLLTPFSLWRHIRWSVTSQIDDKCAISTSGTRHISASAMEEDAVDVPLVSFPSLTGENDLADRCSELPNAKAASWPQLCLLTATPDGRQFVVIQQRLSGRTSFQRNWRDYEVGFGDNAEFWIGLSAIHQLSSTGTLLRVEMKLWSGRELSLEYSGFKVRDAATNYLMTYQAMVDTHVGYDAMAVSNGTQFSTMDRDNDALASGSCSNTYGRGGWWYGECMHCLPNGLMAAADNQNASFTYWHTTSGRWSVRQIRLMLRV